MTGSVPEEGSGGFSVALGVNGSASGVAGTSGLSPFGGEMEPFKSSSSIEGKLSGSGLTTVRGDVGRELLREEGPFAT